MQKIPEDQIELIYDPDLEQFEKMFKQVYGGD